ncbi:MAG: hypothetical protein IJ566_02035 [Cardiobacteriaceae bacterium]|nr:hypothetical protein [Cardiobacteriaceae bacterium]
MKIKRLCLAVLVVISMSLTACKDEETSEASKENSKAKAVAASKAKSQAQAVTKKKKIPDEHNFNLTLTLVIDLNGDGIATSSMKDDFVHFDIDNDGFAEKTAWLDGKDGFLAIDRNANGKIDDASELFGRTDKYANGFEALKELDSNSDGILDANDSAWNDLRLWQDANNDGALHQDNEKELSSLTERGVEKIELSYKNQDDTDGNGNEHRTQANVYWKDGKKTVIEDIYFQHDNAKTLDLTQLDISDEEWKELDKLPHIDAFGNVHSLWVAMSSDATLKTMVKNYVAASPAERVNLLDDLIYRWTGSAGVDPYSRDPTKENWGHVMDARQLVALEKLTGEPYFGTYNGEDRDPNPHGKAAPLLIAQYEKFKTYVSAQIAAQMDYPEIFSPVVVVSRKTLGGDWSKFNDLVNDKFKNGEIEEVKILFNIAIDLGNYSPWYRRDLAKNLDKFDGELKAIIEEISKNKQK